MATGSFRTYPVRLFDLPFFPWAVLTILTCCVRSGCCALSVTKLAATIYPFWDRF
ncbi:Uncharacterised protein [Edwardsiella ictaluri]|nr:Uncharacterised protein [Edwardsiella ictaluri]